MSNSNLLVIAAKWFVVSFLKAQGAECFYLRKVKLNSMDINKLNPSIRKKLWTLISSEPVWVFTVCYTAIHYKCKPHAIYGLTVARLMDIKESEKRRLRTLCLYQPYAGQTFPSEKLCPLMVHHHKYDRLLKKTWNKNEIVAEKIFDKYCIHSVCHFQFWNFLHVLLCENPCWTRIFALIWTRGWIST